MPRGVSLSWSMLLCLTACGNPEEAPRLAGALPPAPEAVAEPAAAETTTEPAVPTTDPIVLVTDRAVLRELEAQGLTASALAFGGGDVSVRSCTKDRGMKVIRAALEKDLAQIRAADPRAGVGMGHGHRLFDIDWLSSDKTRFELIAVVNRTDRHPFERQHCGETRLVYRLAYASEVRGESVDSRLPMTLNVVFWQDADTCADAARRWIPQREDAPLATWLRADDGPLASSRLARSQLKSVEVNAQLVRWPAVMHPSLGGHAEYVLRVFHRDGDSLVVAPLENTPDVPRLKGNAKLRAELGAWLREPDTLAALDKGIPVLPERFAAKKAISVTPRGMGRIANRPYSQLFAAADFEDLDLDARPTLRTPRGLLRRLDELSCQGCHETRSVAGFHILGEPDDASKVLDTMFVATSPHLDGDLARRRSWVAATARGQEADDARPLSDTERNPGGYGSHCGLGDPAFAAWTCDDGLECVELDDPDMGVCLTPDREAGDPCELGDLRTHAKPSRDRVKNVQLLPCDDRAICNTDRVGFPTGMCTKSCTGLGDGEACGAIVNLARFNACVGARRPFPKCIEKAAFPVGMRRCGPALRCRDDYICARSPSDPDVGVCLPPYFLFQMRVDGHVL